MKKLLLATTAILLAAPALAADLPLRSAAIAPAPMMVSMNWTGFYLGVNVGYVAAEEVGVAPFSIELDGFTAGARIGYDIQLSPNWVIGAFADIDAAFAKDTVFGLVRVKTPMMANLNLRVGYLVTPATLLYVTGGYSYADLKISAPFPLPAGLPGSADGWNVGAGIEHRFTQNWSAFIEARYVDLSFDRIAFLRGAPDNTDAWQVKVGVNYRFGGSARPVVARY
ncbi:MAG: porin family protein [Beijerinckiaceae bacterium]|nr:porin family protein [Beijerinckiaceae bacterium]